MCELALPQLRWLPLVSPHRSRSRLRTDPHHHHSPSRRCLLAAGRRPPAVARGKGRTDRVVAGRTLICTARDVRLRGLSHSLRHSAHNKLA
jgi:hypothetical protein